MIRYEPFGNWNYNFPRDKMGIHLELNIDPVGKQSR